VRAPLQLEVGNAGSVPQVTHLHRKNDWIWGIPFIRCLYFNLIEGKIERLYKKILSIKFGNKYCRELKWDKLSEIYNQ